MVLASDRATVGESHLFAAQLGTLTSFYSATAEALGKKPPKMAMPVAMAKASAPLGPVIGPLMGFPPNMRELVRTSDVTITFKDDKARRELGYNGRPLADGIALTVTR